MRPEKDQIPPRQAMHDEDAPEDTEAAAPAAQPAALLSASERAAVLHSLPDDERGPAAAAVGALGGADADALVEVHNAHACHGSRVLMLPTCIECQSNTPRAMQHFIASALH